MDTLRTLRRYSLYIALCTVVLVAGFLAPAAHAAAPGLTPVAAGEPEAVARAPSRHNAAIEARLDRLETRGQVSAPYAVDLSRDANGDGIPDDLAQQVRYLPLGGNLQSGIADLVAALPYSPHTRSLQAQASDLYFRLMSSRLQTGAGLDAAQAQKVAAELGSLERQMWADPDYARTMTALTALLAPGQRLPDGTAAPGQAAGRQAIDWASLRRGDVLLERSAETPWTAKVYAMWYDHAGIYDGSGWVYEANPDGVRRKPLSDWQQPGRYVALARNIELAPAVLASALDAVERAYGTSGRTAYNYVYPDKWSEQQSYCSQLVWQIYSRAGADLDSNDWRYSLWLAARWGQWSVAAVAAPAVAPDELALSPALTVYSQGWLG